MVFPTITIDGVEHEIECIDYMNGKPTLITLTVNDKKVYFWDKYSSFNPDALDLAEEINWKGRYDPVEVALEDLLSAYDDEMTLLSKKIAKLYVEKSAIHPSLIEKHNELKQLINATIGVKKHLETKI